MPVDLSTRLGHVELPNPILTASGCAAAGRELSRFTDVARLGAVVTKSIMLAPRSGRPTPRMAETPSGMLNSIGLQGPGIDAFLQRDLPWLLTQGARAVVSIAGSSAAEYAELARRLSDAPGVTAIEVNISCPNVEDRGTVFACDPDAAAAVIGEVRASARYDIPVFAKLSPDVTDIVTIARACVAAGADGLSLINTLLGMAIDTRTMRPVLAGLTGGLSGPGHPAGRGPVHLAGQAGASRCPDHRHGRRPHRAGRVRADPGRRRDGQPGHGDLPRSRRVRPGAARARRRAHPGRSGTAGGCGGAGASGRRGPAEPGPGPRHTP